MVCPEARFPDLDLFTGSARRTCAYDADLYQPCGVAIQMGDTVNRQTSLQIRLEQQMNYMPPPQMPSQ